MSSNKENIEMKSLRKRPALPARAATEPSIRMARTTTSLATIEEEGENRGIKQDSVRPPFERSWSEKVGQYLYQSLEAVAFADGSSIDSYDSPAFRQQKKYETKQKETQSRSTKQRKITIMVGAATHVAQRAFGLCRTDLITILRLRILEYKHYHA